MNRPNPTPLSEQRLSEKCPVAFKYSSFFNPHYDQIGKQFGENTQDITDGTDLRRSLI